MQIHFKKFEPNREYTLMVYEKDLSNFIENSILTCMPETSSERKDEIFESVFTSYAHLLNELGIYLTPSEE